MRRLKRFLAVWKWLWLARLAAATASSLLALLARPGWAAAWRPQGEGGGSRGPRSEGVSRGPHV